MTRILITGACGFIGTELFDELIKTEDEIVGIDISSKNPKVLPIDISLQESIEKIADFKPEVIIHIAAQVDILKSIQDPFFDMTTNVIGTLNVLQGGILGGVKNFIYLASGGSIYGSSQKLPLTERDQPSPESPYGVSKLAGEFYVRTICTNNGIAWSSLALSNCYGNPAKQKKGVIYNFWKGLKEGTPIFINGETTTRDFIHVSDVIKAILLAIKNPTFCRVHISSNTETKLTNLFELISRRLEKSSEPILRELPTGEVARNRLDNELASITLGWTPELSIAQGINLSITPL